MQAIQLVQASTLLVESIDTEYDDDKVKFMSNLRGRGNNGTRDFSHRKGVFFRTRRFFCSKFRGKNCHLVTFNPTISPHPSVVPTHHPTSSPSKSPTRAPSSIPTISTLPTTSPTESPSLKPSSPPSFAPTILPTTVPTIPPSVASSHHPTVLSSIKPSNIPSVESSTIPSSEPSVHPSKAPTDLPSIHPSDRPTSTPSQFPSESFNPSALPTNTPSIHPSQIPSHTPSIFSSQRPSQVPSIKPSQHPSMMPITAEATCQFTEQINRAKCRSTLFSDHSDEIFRTIVKDQYICSDNMRYRFGITQNDLLCLCDGDKKTWCANECCGTGRNPYAVLEPDGNFVVYSEKLLFSGMARLNSLWESETAGDNPTKLRISNNGELVIENQVDDSIVFWRANQEDFVTGVRNEESSDINEKLNRFARKPEPEIEEQFNKFARNPDSEQDSETLV